MACVGPTGEPTPRVLGRQLPPPQGASGQQLVAKGAALRSQWAPKAPDAPWAPKAPEGQFYPFCTLSLNLTLTLTPTRTLSLILHLPLPIARNLALALTLALTLPKTHPNPDPSPSPSPSPNPSPRLNPRLGSELLFGSKMERNDVTKAAMNEIWGILFNLINMVVWLEGGQGEVKGACDGPTLGLRGMYPPKRHTRHPPPLW